MKCERKNAESCRLQQQQRIKELEKQHQRVRWCLSKKLMHLLQLDCDFLICVFFKMSYFHCTLKEIVSHCVVSCRKDLTDLQKERQCLEKQHQQEINKLNQELQQARTLHNALQAQIDKVTNQ